MSTETVSSYEDSNTKSSFFTFFELLFLGCLLFIVYKAHTLSAEAISENLDFIRMIGIFMPWIGLWRWIAKNELFSFFFSVLSTVSLYYLF